MGYFCRNTEKRVHNPDDVSATDLDFSQPTVIFFHGFIETPQSIDSIELRDAYLEKGGHNLIIANMENSLAGPSYPNAIRNAYRVSKLAACFIDSLADKGLNLTKLHLIGMSLGAHIVGNIGAYVKNGRIGRITGLDPAGPLFWNVPESLRLDKSDALFVDVIHSDAGLFGYPLACGHADFWVNGGVAIQPGCHNDEILRRYRGRENITTVLESALCNHWRSYQIYIESIRNEQAFPSKKCDGRDNYVRGKCEFNEEIVLGFSVPKMARGNYYIETTFPYYHS